jgi:hypothetical protein
VVSELEVTLDRPRSRTNPVITGLRESVLQALGLVGASTSEGIT